MDRKSREIFYGIVIVATLIIAIIGTTMAYFSYRTSSANNTIKAHAAMVDVIYNDGEQVTAQADKLIPASLSVVKSVYEANIVGKGTDTSTSNACIDSNNKQVCSVYRFSIKSLADVNVYTLLNNEYNGFTYLAYAVRDVSNNNWLTMYPNASQDEQFVKLSKCDNTNSKTNDDCYRVSDNRKIYSTNPQANNSIFGYDNTNTPLGKIISTEEHFYDLVLFIYENNKTQNQDQGKEYYGTITVHATDDISGVLSGKSN